MDTGYLLLRTVPGTGQTNIFKTNEVARCPINVPRKTKQTATSTTENPVTYTNMCHVFFHN